MSTATDQELQKSIINRWCYQPSRRLNVVSKHGSTAAVIFICCSFIGNFSTSSFYSFRKFRRVNSDFSVSKWWTSVIQEIRICKVQILWSVLPRQISSKSVILLRRYRDFSIFSRWRLDLFEAYLDQPLGTLIVFLSLCKFGCDRFSSFDIVKVSVFGAKIGFWGILTVQYQRNPK